MLTSSIGASAPPQPWLRVLHTVRRHAMDSEEQPLTHEEITRFSVVCTDLGLRVIRLDRSEPS